MNEETVLLFGLFLLCCVIVGFVAYAIHERRRIRKSFTGLKIQVSMKHELLGPPIYGDVVDYAGEFERAMIEQILWRNGQIAGTPEDSTQILTVTLRTGYTPIERRHAFQLVADFKMIARDGMLLLQGRETLDDRIRPPTISSNIDNHNEPIQRDIELPEQWGTTPEGRIENVRKLATVTARTIDRNQAIRKLAEAAAKAERITASA